MGFENFILENYPIKKTNNKNEIRIDCPCCGDRKGHGYINLKKAVYHCFRCHTGLNAYGFLKQVHGMTSTQIERVLGGDFSVAAPVRVSGTVTLQEISLPSCYKPLERSNSVVGGKAWDYVCKRVTGNVEAVVRRFRMGYCYGGEMAGRVILPVYHKGALVYYQARAFYPSTMEPKYNAPSVPKPVFGLEGVQPGQHLTLVEGYFDALALGDCACAVFGSSISKLQLRMLLEAQPSGFTICFDPDKAGRKGALDTAATLAGFVRDINVVLELPKDPADLGSDAVYEVRKRVRRYGPKLLFETF